jgi:uncharacterized membrane protein required for colicin V production
VLATFKEIGIFIPATSAVTQVSIVTQGYVVAESFGFCLHLITGLLILVFFFFVYRHLSNFSTIWWQQAVTITSDRASNVDLCLAFMALGLILAVGVLFPVTGQI